MNRREFITLSAVRRHGRSTAGAEQVERVRRIGVLMSVAADGPGRASPVWQRS